MSQFAGFTDFDPAKHIPSLKGKVIFITGGTAGLGRQSVQALAQHEPEHIYFSGRDAKAGERLVAEVREATACPLTFVEMDMNSLASVKAAVVRDFAHDRLDVLMCNAGIMTVPLGLSADGFEVHFAVNHLGNAMVARQLLPVLLRTAKMPGADVRIVNLTSVGWQLHPGPGIVFDALGTTQDGFGGPWIRYGQSKLANVVYAAELARRHPEILTVSVHPGVSETGLVTNLSTWRKRLVYWGNWAKGYSLMTPEQGAYSQLWCVAGARRADMVNGAYYMPIGVVADDKLDKVALSRELADRLWEWTEEVLAKH